MKYQTINQKEPIDRTLHVWRRRKSDGLYKCMLCGGLAKLPSLNDLCDKYEPLTNEERAVCPEKPPPKR